MVVGERYKWSTRIKVTGEKRVGKSVQQHKIKIVLCFDVNGFLQEKG